MAVYFIYLIILWKIKRKNKWRFMSIIIDRFQEIVKWSLCFLGSNIGQLVEQKEAILFNVLNKNKSSLCGIKTKIKDFGHKSIILYTPK